ncbi:tryptophan synthase subunit beta [Halobacterium noricense]|uniref:tryptophan synthase subunit beta n=1 Tax=Halobacterium noricense TaxID=223182 RepID=UPI001E46445B|nr:tryptophan synthase subunit beta [Halobacterium noricense]UHH25775.1 tryptophan synthase subunit beta [Halobacterium noricense]
MSEESKRTTGAQSETQAGKFGAYGGQYVPEVLMPAVEELADAYERYVLGNEDGFVDDFRQRIREFGGRPTPLSHAENLSGRYGFDVYLKREDLLHGGAHKLNNALGQVLLAKYMGKERIVAETGAGQHGTATAMACAYLDMPCEIYMGRTDVNRQRPNVFRMRIHDAEVNPVDVGSGTLKEAINETMRDWATNVEDTHYVIGSVVGPHPFPAMVRDFQSVISEEMRVQSEDQLGRLPEAVIACAGGGSNTMGAFAAFVGRADHRSAEQGSGGVATSARLPGAPEGTHEPAADVDLLAVEAGGSSLGVDKAEGYAPNSASLSTGTEGVLHGARTKLLQTEEGQIVESHSVSAGLDYAGVGPELAYLVDEGRVEPVNVDDDAALEAFHRLSREEGIIPALESSHAVAYLEGYEGDGPVVVNVSGRGDKDLDTVIEESAARDIAGAPTMEVFEE